MITRTQKRLVFFLRFISVCQLLAFLAVFLPINIWLGGWYRWLDLGEVPQESAILRYVIGATAFFQGAIGVWMWVMISDVPRYMPLLRVSSGIYLLASPVFYFIDFHSGLPLWWRLYDVTWCFIVGIALFMLCKTPSESHHA